MRFFKLCFGINILRLTLKCHNLHFRFLLLRYNPFKMFKVFLLQIFIFKNLIVIQAKK